MQIRDIDIEDAPQIAGLHIEEISTGFISSLGLNFVISLYQGIAESSCAIGYVCEDKSEIAGFICCATDINKLYRELILHKGFSFFIKLFGQMFSIERIKNVLQTLLYPGKDQDSNTKTEILSVAVRSGNQGKGIGRQLMDKMLDECRSRGIKKVKVSTLDQNIQANQYYQTCGFKLADKIKHHDNYLNVYVIDL